jgi:hypothetical protein
MAWRNVYCVDPGTFSYDADNPTKYTEELSFWLQKNLYFASGSWLPKVVESEKSAVSWDYGTLPSDIAAWLVGVDAEVKLASEEERDPVFSNLPSIPDGTGEPYQDMIIKVLVKLVIEIFLHWWQKRKENKVLPPGENMYELVKTLFGQTYEDEEGEEHLVSLLQRVAEERDVRVDFNDGVIRVYPGSLSVDVDFPANGG